MGLVLASMTHNDTVLPVPESALMRPKYIVCQKQGLGAAGRWSAMHDQVYTIDGLSGGSSSRLADPVEDEENFKIMSSACRCVLSVGVAFCLPQV
ncbi:hypothetical protein ElyMa_004971200 [Elysia marginata]|uniref:Uncharacterized protein n=1 Tax=Elysia marginata TaxID=1093978 RepID=A0AAV4J7W3_9GAST|nr:hypothetical protein ElyMa_004971200 [Elysia marginata]